MDKAIREAAQRMAGSADEDCGHPPERGMRAEDGARREFGAAAFQHDMAGLRLWREIGGKGAKPRTPCSPVRRRCP